MEFESLFKPIKIGNTEVKNRVFMPPVSTNLANHGYITDALVEHYASRAKGGVGLIITEVTTVEPTYTYLPGDICLYDDSFIEGWKKLTQEVHRYGCKILPQLFHPAFMAYPLPGTPRLIAPSNVGPYYARQAPRAVTKEELKVIIKQFGQAALRVKKAGGDGVEIHAAHAHGLLGGFLTPLYNKRTDEYGGDINGRLRLTLEVIEEVRKECGQDFIIDVRISGDEYSDGGLNLNDMIYVSKQLEKAGVDFIHVSGGNTIKRASSIPAPGTKQGSHSALSKEIKKYVKIPVTTVGRINEPWIANELIENGSADICMIGRANICDSEFVNKAKEGRVDDIRPCIGCLRCLNGVMFGKPIECSVNPAVEIDVIEKASTTKDILVVGGGPAGMESAIIAARRGHHVVLCEASDDLGGLLRLASVPIGKQELCKVIKYLKRQLALLNVEVRLNTRVDKEMLNSEFKEYEVILSTGSNPIELDMFNRFKQVMTGDDVLSGNKYPGKKIVVVGGGSVGCEVADYLAPLVNDLFPANRRITLIEMSNALMAKEVGAAKSVLTLRLKEKGVDIKLNSKVTRVEKDKIYYLQDDKEYCIKDEDTIVMTLGYHSENSLIEALKDHTYYLVGDCKEIGNLKTAIASAYNITKNI